jgi:multisubunit Na+/H+ antiporter MnhC subunit
MVNGLNPARYPQFDYVRAFIAAHAARLRAARQRKDAGASAMELAIITAIVVAFAIFVLLAVKTVIDQRSGQIKSNNTNVAP